MIGSPRFGVLALVATLVTACWDATPDATIPVAADAPRGSVSLGVIVGPSDVVDGVDYDVSGNGQSISDRIELSDPKTTPSIELGLPEGTGYDVSLSAVTRAGVHCAGQGSFDVVAGLTSSVTVNLLCDPVNDGDGLGQTVVHAHFIPGDPSLCPQIQFYTVSPLRASVGRTITVQGAGTAGTVVAGWGIVPGGNGTGHFEHVNAPSDLFHCDSGGTLNLVFVVGDGKSCYAPSLPVVVTCVGPGICGNGVLQPDEQCDDGNTNSGDGCSSTCQNEIVCGNGSVEGTEQCDPPAPGFCSPTCQDVPPVCGDGFVQAGEECDPPVPWACSAECTIQTPCGNGLLDPGEDCDPPNTAFCGPTCAFGGACTTCEEKYCSGPVIHTACSDGAGGDLCVAAVQCARQHACYFVDPALCYCGTHDISHCQNPTPDPANGPNGPCVAEYEAAAGTSTAAAVLSALDDPGNPLGRAAQMETCDSAFCASACR
ncbi:MAG TPA: DUF4215 domain-containing protein [Polyangiaceae bacterium]|nr:DUF4215 domain-containing protein [Polyangiaceae bacterium]